MSTVKSRTLYVSNLAFDVTKVMVEDAFDVEGYPLENVELIMKGKQGYKKTCGLASVTLLSLQDLDACMAKMDGHAMLGRAMMVRSDRFMEDNAAYKQDESTSS
ncbi:MAG: hypothetical protein WDW38_001200 [Sanguina aurantia]